MGSEGAPEFMYGTGLYYTGPSGYYGSYDPTGLTGMQATGKWDENQSYFGLDRQDLHYPGFQGDGSQCVYYSPDYGYVPSSYDPYNPYSLNSMTGLDGSLLGAQQQYMVSPNPNPNPNANPTFPQPIPSPTYLPYVYPTGTETTETLSYANFPFVSKDSGEIAKFTNPVSSSNRSVIGPQKVSKSNPALEFQSATKVLKSPILNLPAVKQNAQVVNPSVEHLSKSNPNIVNTGSIEPIQQNRTNRATKTNHSPTLSLKSYTNRIQIGDKQGNITIKTDWYNRDDLSLDYSFAKFFVIKSYSEDDVHKSIKYSVWSSTPNGNKKLNAAYEDAQKLSTRNNGIKCPVFLFFSVNGSGHFCGVAEMEGPVDFNRDMDFWQQDKWTGSFPVNWIIMKDIPNTCLRQILLENNEFKPVTHSRDTQDIPQIQGIAMLKIFKSTQSKESVLDDFLKYEELERNTHRRRSKLLNSDAPVFIPTFHPLNNPTTKTDNNPIRPQVAPEKKQYMNTNNSNNNSSKNNSELRAEEIKPNENNKKETNPNPNPNHMVHTSNQLEKGISKAKENPNFGNDKPISKTIPSASEVKGKVLLNGTKGILGINPSNVLSGKIASLSISSTVSEENGRSSCPADVVTIGSMHVRVKKSDEAT